MPRLVDPPTPNDQAEHLIGRRYLSPSSIATYQLCPLQFYFRYVAGLPDEEPSPSLRFGQAIHAAIEHYHLAQQDGYTAPLAELRQVFREHWQPSGADGPATRTVEDSETFALGDRMLHTFLEFTAGESNQTVVGVEREFCGPLGDGIPDLLARVDLLTLEEGTLLLTDYKTARSRWSPAQADASAGQLLLYADLVGREFPGLPIALRFVVLTKTKRPKVEVWPIFAAESHFLRQRAIVVRIWSAIRARHFFPTPSPMTCSTGPYQTPCQSWPHLPTG